LTPDQPAGRLVDVVVPVYNEERDLGPSVRRLRAFLDTQFPLPAMITPSWTRSSHCPR